MATRRQAILVIEDDDDVRTLFQMILEAAGYAVDTARTETVAHTYLLMRVYDLVLTDWKLGTGGDGLKIADAAHQNGVVTIIVSGQAAAIPDHYRARHTVLAKPLKPVELVEAVERRLGSASAS